MGGLMILSGLIVSTVLWADLRNHYVWIVLLVMTGFGAIGFYDDLLKVTKQTHKGFSGRRRLALEDSHSRHRLLRDDETRAAAHDCPGLAGDQWFCH